MERVWRVRREEKESIDRVDGLGFGTGFVMWRGEESLQLIGLPLDLWNSLSQGLSAF